MRRLAVEQLEDRRLLAVVAYDAGTDALTFTADAGDADDVQFMGDTGANTLTILVGNGDVLTLAGDADASADFVLSTTNTTNDTLTIDVSNSAVADLTVNGGDGNDTLTVDYTNGTFNIPITFHGQNPTTGPGDRIVLNGGTADTITHNFTNASDGSIALDFNGGGVDSTITYTGLEPVDDNVSAANRVFTFTGGAETIVLRDDATANDNRSLIDSTLGESVTFVNPTASLIINAGSGADAVNVTGADTGTDTMTFIPSLTINGGAGNDTLSVVPGQTAITVKGDDPGDGDAGVPPGDRLIIALPDGVTLDNNPVTPGGTAMLTGAENVTFTSIEQLIVVAADALENNNTLATASVLGSPAQVTVNKLSIHQPGDVDFFKYTAHETGKLIVRTLFDHDIGDLDLEVQDMAGNVIHDAMNSVTGTNQEQIIIPVVDQQMVFIRVLGADGAINNYDLVLENTAAPIPERPEVHPDDDSGTSSTDNISEVTAPRVLVQADLADFAAMGIPILGSTDAAAGLMPGAAVEVFLNGVSQGFADGVGTSTTLFQFRLDPDKLADGLEINGGVLNYVTAAVRIFADQREAAGGAPATISGRTQLSERLALRTVDTTGPQISGVSIPGFAAYDLLASTPSTAGPTPVINQLAIEFTDPPDRGGIFSGDALDGTRAENPAFYALVGDASGPAAIQSAQVTTTSSTAGEPATATVTLTFVEPLPDDRFTFTVRDKLTDPAGNQLDGESGGTESSGAPVLPSGDGSAGGDFVTRFTVDTRPELGVWAAGLTIVDANGNFRLDRDNPDPSNPDTAYPLGFSSDRIFAGNFSGPGPDGNFGTAGDTGAAEGDASADGFDKLAAYGRVGNQWRWMIDTSSDGMPDRIINEPLNINGLPVAGNFDGNVANGDEVGVFDGSRWYFDTDHDFQLDAASMLAASYTGFPIVGDFDGDGSDDLGAYTAITNGLGGNLFSIDTNRDGAANNTFRVAAAVGGAAGGLNGFAGVRERPVAADMNADGVDDIGLWVPDGYALVPGNQGEWYFWVSNPSTEPAPKTVPSTEPAPKTVLDRAIDGDGLVSFTPSPAGNDFFARFGSNFALPVVGNFYSPGAAASSGVVSLPPTDSPATASAVTSSIVVADVKDPQPTPIPDRDHPVTSQAQATESPLPAVVALDQPDVAVPLERNPARLETPLPEAAETPSTEQSAADSASQRVEPIVAPVVEIVPVAAAVGEEVPAHEAPLPIVVEAADDPTPPLTPDENGESESAANSPAVAAAATITPEQPVVRFFSRIFRRPAAASRAPAAASLAAEQTTLHQSLPEVGDAPDAVAADPPQAAATGSDGERARPPLASEQPESTAAVPAGVAVPDAQAKTAPQQPVQQTFSRVRRSQRIAPQQPVAATRTETPPVKVASSTTPATSFAVSAPTSPQTTIAKPQSTAGQNHTPASLARQQSALDEPRVATVNAAPANLPRRFRIFRSSVFTTQDAAAQQPRAGLAATDGAFHEQAIVPPGNAAVEAQMGRSRPATKDAYRAEIQAELLHELAEDLVQSWS